MRPSELGAGRLTSVRIEERAQPGKGLLVVIPATAHVTNPGREVRNKHEFLAQPGKVRNETQAHHASLTLIAGKRTGSFFGYRSLRHLNL
jgi:hypothetical protein